MKGENEDERGAPARHERECQTSEEDEESGNSHTKKKKNTCTDGASIEVVRRPRGRPPGSKNKPKPPIIITRDPTDTLMHPHILQLPAGIDVVDSITRFARRRNVGLCILTGTGTVANVTLRHPTTTSSSSSTVTFHGHFEILSISATFLPPSSSFSSFSNGFTISLAGAHGQIVGGSVVGSLVAAGTIVVVATAFVNPSFHRLPEDDEISASGVSVSGSETSSHLHQQQHQQQRHGHDPDAMDCSSGMSIYSCHLPCDVIWAPIPRPPSAPY